MVYELYLKNFLKYSIFALQNKGPTKYSLGGKSEGYNEHFWISNSTSRLAGGSKFDI